MADFKNSFALGLEAAADAAAKMAEIESVFEDLNSQLSDASDGKIRIIRKARFRNPFAAAVRATSSLTGVTLDGDEATYIVATNPLSDTRAEEDLAVWVVDSRGYPCKIIFGGQNYFCEDKAALEKVLSLLLAWPDTGKAFQRLIDLPATSE